MLDSKTIDLLRFMASNKQGWLTDQDIIYAGIAIDPIWMDALIKSGYVDCVHTAPAKYRISAFGKAEIEQYDRQKNLDFRWWITTAIALIALIKSFF